MTIDDVGHGACDAQAVQWAIGCALSDEVLERARVHSRSAALRVIRPDDLVTMDHREDRLNLYLDAHDVIVRVRCG
ncbi:MAG: hypothetical protein AVDCRST_MAG71-1626 [uncultured Lysobacter sp.]|uniref:Peptidase inhibitor I78 family protein n=1 Tax=uncultured Lysobacter sp. TaxID=271060 RepID=A0A6J4LAA0_9GAMM|nr:MAG: hypothetical protein AVDCRST_MAG71-1626 [uncultured Lysobacter sp.]